MKLLSGNLDEWFERRKRPYPERGTARDSAGARLLCLCSRAQDSSQIGLLGEGPQKRTAAAGNRRRSSGSKRDQGAQEAGKLPVDNRTA